MHAKRRHFTVLAFFIFCVQALFPQFNNFKKWSVKSGLAQSDVYDILQDSRGYIWIATAGGASVFDGTKFKNYSRSSGICGNTVRALFEDSKKRIWFGTNAGICCYDGVKFRSVSTKGYKGSTTLCFA